MANILLPTDFSSNALNAVRTAFALYTEPEDRFTIVHVHMDPHLMNSAWVDVSASIEASAKEGMAEFMAQVKALPNADPARIKARMAAGSPGLTLLKVCVAEKSDVIVMGTLGRGNSRFIGSVALDMIENGRIPVLVVPAGAKTSTLTRILLADDNERVSLKGIAFVQELARRTGAEVVIGHVLKDAEEEPNAEVVAAYETGFAEVPHRYEGVEGEDPAAALDLLADEEGAGVIALLRRPYEPILDLFRKSTSRRLIKGSHTPLLVLQPEEDLA